MSAVQIRDLATHAEYQACLVLQEEIWGAGFSERVPPALLKVCQEIGGVAAGAFDEDGVLLGFVFGLTGIREQRLVHWSDILAVRESARGHGIGIRLKAFQRERVRALGVHVMYWTFDPLVARNGYLNISRLGAAVVAYRPDMYGSNTGSALHGRLPTDRFLVEWDLSATLAKAAGSDAEAALLNPLSPSGLPTAVEPPPASVYRIQVPRDFAEVQRAGADAALAWRMCVRQVAQPLLDRGWRVVRFLRGTTDRLPCYVVTAPERTATP